MNDQLLLKKAYELVKANAAKSHLSNETRIAIKRLCELSLDILINRSSKVDLVSKVPGKKYFSYQADKSVARPANASLFIDNLPLFKKAWEEWESGVSDNNKLLKLLYTAALAPCLAMELFDKQNKKGPATYFECFIGHLFSRKVQSEPTKKATLKIEGSNVRLTMDFLFDNVANQTSYHVPVKMSTRERVVQAWAHQRLLDSAYGEGAYKGVMMLFSETKLDSRNLEVVEICVPEQWLAYQKHLAKMDEIYYFDMPQRYQELGTKHSKIFCLKDVSHFFK